MWFPYFFFSLYNFYICNSWVRLCCCAACHSIRYMNSNVADLVSGSTKTIARWSVYVWKKKIIEKKNTSLTATETTSIRKPKERLWKHILMYGLFNYLLCECINACFLLATCISWRHRGVRLFFSPVAHQHGVQTRSMQSRREEDSTHMIQAAHGTSLTYEMNVGAVCCLLLLLLLLFAI